MITTTRHRRSLLAACALTLVLGLVSAMPTPAVGAAEAPTGHGPDLTRRMDEALERASSAFGDAGVQAVAIRHGRVIWSGTRGSAVLDPPVRVTDRSMFSFASLSKLLLTAFVLHRVEEGVLDLDEPISTYVGDEVAGSRAVTVRMLLTHTAGYPDLYSDPATAPLFPPPFAGGPGDQYDPNRPYTFDMLNAGIREPVDPGARFEYSNTGFIVLGHVLTRISGGDDAFRRAYQRYIRAAGTLLAPMTENLVTMERSERALRRFAHGYTPLDNGSLQDFFTAYGATGIPTDLYGLPFTDGLFAGTALGAGLVLDGLFARGRLLRPETVRQMIAPTPASDGSYGMGTRRVTAGGRTWQGHGGSYVGFNSMAATDLARGVTIVVVVNRLTPQRPADVIWGALAEACASGTS